MLIFSAHASTHAVVVRTPTVDQMTCRQAISYVQKYQRYYIHTVDGAIPIWPITPMGQNQEVKLKEMLSFHVVRTQDQERCLIGYSARNGN